MRGLQPSILKSVIDEKEACISHCFLPVKGKTDAMYCMEKCNKKFDLHMGKILNKTNEIFVE